MPSKVFDPYRALGIVSGDIPFAVNSLGTQTFVSVVVNKAFQVYKCDKLGLSLVSPQLEEDIRFVLCTSKIDSVQIRGTFIMAQL